MRQASIPTPPLSAATSRIRTPATTPSRSRRRSPRHLDPKADLSVTKTVSNPTPVVGDSVTFTITVLNNGPSEATGVTVADALPSGYTLVSLTPSQGTVAGGVWTVGNLASGASATLQIVATVNATGFYSNTATVSGNQPDPEPGNNTISITPAPIRMANLMVNKTVDNPTPTVGENVTFTITVTNNGPAVAAGVILADTLPSGYTLVSATPSKGTLSGGLDDWHSHPGGKRYPGGRGTSQRFRCLCQHGHGQRESA